MTMRNRKNVIVAFVLVAVMLMAVGYATLTDTLTIIGNITTDKTGAENNFAEKIYFSAAEKVDAQSNSTGTANPDSCGFSGNDATYAVHSIAVKDEYVTFKFTITNDTNVPVYIQVNPTKTGGSANPSNSNATFFKVDYTYENDDRVIASGSTMDVYVKVTAIAPITEVKTATMGIELVATTDVPTP